MLAHPWMHAAVWRRLGMVAAVVPTVVAGPVVAEPILGDTGVLPRGTDFGEPALQVPRQILTVEHLGSEQNFLIALGNMAFSSPEILGGLARRAGISCATCHVSGEANSALFIPGHSSRPGTFDVTGSGFNPKADDGLFNPVDIPSLRGVRLTAPYGRDGRFPSLREFTRNAIVNEFAGAEPSPLMLDAMVIYMQQFEFLPNPKIGEFGRLTAAASEAAHRGEALFMREFPQMGGGSCASCHIPSALFIDKRQHDVGTGGVYDTPTLLGINFTAPYFHDGRADTLEQVVDHFDASFDLALTDDERRDLVAYLQAVGEGEEPFQTKDLAFDMAEVEIFTGLIDVTLEERDAALTRLVVDTVNAELRDVAEHWYRPEDRPVRRTIASWVVQLRRVATQAEAQSWADGEAALAVYRAMLKRDLPTVAAAEDRSLYDPVVLEGYLTEIRRLKTADLPK